MLAISHRHGDHSSAINTLPGNLFFDMWTFKEDLLCYLLEYPNTRDWLICHTHHPIHETVEKNGTSFTTRFAQRVRVRRMQ